MILCPTKSLYHKTPQEARTGYKPDIKYLRVFGCVAYAHMLDEKRKKLDDKGEACIFVGYNGHSKAYKLYNSISKKIMINRDVIFNEEKAFK